MSNITDLRALAITVILCAEIMSEFKMSAKMVRAHFPD
jgi:hypothetical protein